jgi:hypothetical protein
VYFSSSFKDPDLIKRDPDPNWSGSRSPTLIWATPAIYQSKINFSFHCSYSDAVLLQTAKTLPLLPGTANFALRCDSIDMWQFAVKTRLQRLETGHPNMSFLQMLVRAMPQWKAKLESEFWQNSRDLRSQIYITVAKRRPILKREKVFVNLSLGQINYSIAS